MNINTKFRKNTLIVASLLALAPMSQAAVSIVGDNMDYGISGAGSNGFSLDFTAQPIWTAGSQRSDNGDPPNRRSGRAFVEFQLTAGMIAEANLAGAAATFTFTIDSIGSGVTGTAYTDGLDLRYYGTNAADRSASDLWNTGGIGGDQADILATTGPTGASTVSLTNANILSDIAAATTGDYIAFGMLNSVGTTGDPVGNSTAETYGFQVNTTASNYSLTVAVPEPSSAALLGLGGLALVLRRRK